MYQTALFVAAAIYSLMGCSTLTEFFRPEVIATQHGCIPWQQTCSDRAPCFWVSYRCPTSIPEEFQRRYECELLRAESAVAEDFYHCLLPSPSQAPGKNCYYVNGSGSVRGYTLCR